MTPDAWTNLQIVNCTSFPLISGAGKGGGGIGFFNAYQMNSWFNAPNAAPNPIVASRATASYMLQFLRGVGDEDDGADIQLNLGTATSGASSVVWLQARSAQNSAHYLQAQLQQPTVSGAGPFAVAVTQQGTWPLDEPGTGLTWYAGTQLAPLGAPDADQCLAIVDLGAIVSQDVAQALVQMMVAGTLSADDAESLWMGVMSRMHWRPGAKAA
ncbi:hypothetical protein [Methylobacterium platani]|uniref:Uncharacterized protein n=1 Tax=Methylobacterium platani TaxID=427683 RepID=A0A179RUD7_9HYPH|nr:hypothetical protein [Methylobacterium platani]OAS12360.1 hypothetical protein A5481_31470 [Methylobacterium platani]